MFCPNCQAEYREGFIHCSDCDVDLVPKLPEESKSMQIELDTDDAFVSLFSTYNLADIAVIKSILDDNEIEYFIQGENTAYIRGYMDPSILKVRKDQADTVKELLKDFDIKFLMFRIK